MISYHRTSLLEKSNNDDRNPLNYLTKTIKEFPGSIVAAIYLSKPLSTTLWMPFHSAQRTCFFGGDRENFYAEHSSISYQIPIPLKSTCTCKITWCSVLSQTPIPFSCTKHARPIQQLKVLKLEENTLHNLF